MEEHKIAVIGSGPAGMYVSDFLSKKENLQIDIFEKLNEPFGLVRFGVSPDHGQIKNVTRMFEKVLQKPNVNLFLNREVADPVALESLREKYSAVVLATGAYQDRPLTIPGMWSESAYGSAEFVGWYNSHPEFTHVRPDLANESVAIIGVGNVAIDVARMLAKVPDEHQNSIMTDSVRTALAESKVKDIHIVGRRGPLQSKFTLIELAELKRLEAATVKFCEDTLEEIRELLEEADSLDRMDQKKLQIMQELAEANAEKQAERCIHFHFWRTPESYNAENAQLTLSHSNNGEQHVVNADILVSAIGFLGVTLGMDQFDHDNNCFVSNNGDMGEGLFATGWSRRGATGVIPDNRKDALEVANQVQRFLGIE